MSEKRTEKAQIESKVHEDGAISHKITFADGEHALVVVKADSPLMQQFAVNGQRVKLQSTINGADDLVKARERISKLEKAWDEGRYSIYVEKEKGGLLARALAALSSKPVAEMMEVVSGLSREQQAKWRKDPRVAAKILELQAAEDSKPDAALEGLLGSVDLDEDEGEEAA